MSEHTKTPWHIENEPMNIWDELGRLIARVNCPMEPDEAWERGMANARLIVRAVNAHEDLVAALERAEQFVAGVVQEYYGHTDELQSIRAALAKARS